MTSHPSIAPVQAPPILAVAESIVIPVLREEVQVQVLHEHSGSVRVRKVIHEVSEPVAAQGYQEVVETTRVPVNRVVQAVEAPRDMGNVLVIPIYEERLVKQLVLVEEIHLTRQRVPFENHVSVSLRQEEVIVERLDSQTGQWVPEAP